VLKIEELTKSHNRKNFDCGNDDLNNYLKNIARQHIMKGISKTFVLIDDNDSKAIMAYMTLVACEVLIKEMPHNWKKKYPKHVLPAVKLARLAVLLEQQRKGYGELLIIDSIKKTIDVSNNLGIVGLFVDAKNKEAKAYYEQFGFISLPDQMNNLFLPLSTLIELMKDDIKK